MKAVTYSLIIVLVALAIVSGMNKAGDTTNQTFNNAACAMNGATVCALNNSTD